MSSTRTSLLATALLVAAAAAAIARPAAAAGAADTTGTFNLKHSGEGTYYGTRTRGFGHCSFHMSGFGDSPAYAGTPLAINAAQYAKAICGLCVKYRGVGEGLGGTPIATSSWQPGFICDECPECKWGDIDQQTNGDGRWKVEWFATQCPVGASTFRFGYQGGNPWYRKMMVANARVPVKAVALRDGDGSWKPLIKTVDNYFEYHGDTSKAWAPCAAVRVTSILGDTVEDRVCCSSGTCSGAAQFPCRSDMPSDDCPGAARAPPGVNVGGIAPAQPQPQPQPQKQQVTTEAAAKAQVAGSSRAPGPASLEASRVATGPRVLSRGQQCGGAKFDCAKFQACADKPFADAVCDKGFVCRRNDANFWGCQP